LNDSFIHWFYFVRTLDEEQIRGTIATLLKSSLFVYMVVHIATSSR